MQRDLWSGPSQERESHFDFDSFSKFAASFILSIPLRINYLFDFYG